MPSNILLFYVYSRLSQVNISRALDDHFFQNGGKSQKYHYYFGKSTFKVFKIDFDIQNSVLQLLASWLEEKTFLQNFLASPSDVPLRFYQHCVLSHITVSICYSFFNIKSVICMTETQSLFFSLPKIIITVI